MPSKKKTFRPDIQMKTCIRQTQAFFPTLVKAANPSLKGIERQLRPIKKAWCPRRRIAAGASVLKTSRFDS